jgi:hypothetical protein
MDLTIFNNLSESLLKNAIDDSVTCAWQTFTGGQSPVPAHGVAPQQLGCALQQLGCGLQHAEVSGLLQ